ncbi:MAG: hypothetical protein IH899_08245 [Planctomycetes bacterium]|nr:hypothetical protein [Planctomycetota bacterium]
MADSVGTVHQRERSAGEADERFIIRGFEKFWEGNLKVLLSGLGGTGGVGP